MEKQPLSARQLEAMWERPEKAESAAVFLQDVDRFIGIIEASRYEPNPVAEKLAKIGLANAFGVLTDLGYIDVAWDDIRLVVGTDSALARRNHMRELVRAKNLRRCGNNLLADNNFNIGNPLDKDDLPISTREVAERDYWPILRKVFKF